MKRALLLLGPLLGPMIPCHFFCFLTNPNSLTNLYPSMSVFAPESGIHSSLLSMSDSLKSIGINEHSEEYRMLSVSGVETPADSKENNNNKENAKSSEEKKMSTLNQLINMAGRLIQTRADLEFRAKGGDKAEDIIR